MLPNSFPGARISTPLRALMSPVALPRMITLLPVTRAFAHDQHVFRGDLALHVAVDANGPGEVQLAAHAAALAEARLNLTELRALGLFPFGHRMLLHRRDHGLRL